MNQAASALIGMSGTYSGSNDCNWKAQCPSGAVAKVTVIHLNTESGYDYVRMCKCFAAFSSETAAQERDG